MSKKEVLESMAPRRVVKKPKLTKLEGDGKVRYIGATEVAKWITQEYGFYCTPNMVTNALHRSVQNNVPSTPEILRKHYPQLFV